MISKNVFQLCFDESSFKIKFLSIADAAHVRSMKEKWNVTHFIHKLDVYGWLVVHFYLSSLMWDTAQYVWHISSNNWSVLFFHGIFHLLSMMLWKYKWIDRKTRGKWNSCMPNHNNSPSIIATKERGGKGLTKYRCRCCRLSYFFIYFDLLDFTS